jgi:hypothetical protein
MRLFGDAKNVDSTDRCCTGDCLHRVLRRAATKFMAALLLFVGPYSSSAQDHPLKIGVLALGPRYLPAWHCGQADYRPGSDEPKQDTEPYYVRGLLEQLSKLNYVEARPENAGKPGRRFVLTFRTGTSQQLREFAREFVTDQTDIIVGVAAATIQIAQQETQGHPIPILMTGVSNMARSSRSRDREGTSLVSVIRWCREAVGEENCSSNATRSQTYAHNPAGGYAPSEISMDEVREAANRLNIEILDRTTESRQEIKEVMANVQPGTVDGIMILPDSHIIANLDLVIETSLARRVPAFGVEDYQATWGAVAADGPSARGGCGRRLVHRQDQQGRQTR